MSVPDPILTRKSGRLGLYIPFALLILAAIAWSAFWLWSRGEVRSRMDAAVADLARAGYQVSWKDRSQGGYPFRMDLTLHDVRIREPSGWALEVPDLEAEAFLYSPGHWILAAPQGLTFVRPVGGPVLVKGEMIRASLTDFDKTPPSFSLEAVKPTFQPAPGAQPFSLSAADRVEFHLRAGPDDEGGVFAKLDNGKAQLSGLFARIAGDKPISIQWNSTLSKMSAFHGSDWAQMVRAWSDAGGQISVRQAGVTAGDALIGANGGTLGVGRDGRLTGVLNVTLRQAPKALGVMGETGVLPRETADAAAAVTAAREGPDAAAQATLTFQAGQTTLGPVAIGPAPKIYEPRR